MATRSIEVFCKVHFSASLYDHLIQIGEKNYSLHAVILCKSYDMMTYRFRLYSLMLVYDCVRKLL